MDCDGKMTFIEGEIIKDKNFFLKGQLMTISKLFNSAATYSSKAAIGTCLCQELGHVTSPKPMGGEEM